MTGQGLALLQMPIAVSVIVPFTIASWPVSVTFCIAVPVIALPKLAGRFATRFISRLLTLSAGFASLPAIGFSFIISFYSFASGSLIRIQFRCALTCRHISILFIKTFTLRHRFHTLSLNLELSSPVSLHAHALPTSHSFH